MDDTNSTTFNTNNLDDTEEDSFFCEICNEKFQLQQLYACYQGHFFCKKCYRQEYYKGKEAKCPHLTCNAWIDQAHEKLKRRQATNLRISNKMFPQPGFYVTGKVSSPSLAKLTTSYSLQSLSKRPLFCPLRHCNKAIAVKLVEYHFECEHKSVATISTHLEARNGMEFQAVDIRLNEILCICLIKLKKPEDCEVLPSQKFETGSVGPLISKNPSLLIMATKLLMEYPEKKFMEGYCDYSHSEKYFLWVSSNLATNFNYTLALSSHCNKLRIKYYGPLLTLNEDFKSLCIQGKGLILTHRRIRGMTADMTSPLVLDILIHGPDS